MRITTLLLILTMCLLLACSEDGPASEPSPVPPQEPATPQAPARESSEQPATAMPAITPEPAATTAPSQLLRLLPTYIPEPPASTASTPMPAAEPLAPALAVLPAYTPEPSPTATPVSTEAKQELRDEDRTGEFHRYPVTVFAQFRVDVEKTEGGCTVNPADITVADGQRVRLAVQLQSDVELKTTYQVDGLTIASSGGAFGLGVTDVNIEIESGGRRSYDFNAAGAGAFDILCDGTKIGTFTVN